MYVDTQNLRTWDLIDHETYFHMHNVLLTLASVSDLPTSFSIKSPEPETPLGIYLMSRWQFLLFKKKNLKLTKKKLQVLSFLLNLTVTYWPDALSPIPKYFLQTMTFSYTTIKIKKLTYATFSNHEFLKHQIPPDVSIASFTARESSSESCFTFSCYVSLVSFILQYFLSFPWFSWTWLF